MQKTLSMKNFRWSLNWILFYFRETTKKFWNHKKFKFVNFFVFFNQLSARAETISTKFNNYQRVFDGFPSEAWRYLPSAPIKAIEINFTSEIFLQTVRLWITRRPYQPSTYQDALLIPQRVSPSWQTVSILISDSLARSFSLFTELLDELLRVVKIERRRSRRNGKLSSKAFKQSLESTAAFPSSWKRYQQFKK